MLDAGPMELRNLHRRARPFRYLSFWSMALVCALLLGTPREPVLLLLVGAACLAWPLCADRRERGRAPAAGGDARRVMRTHLLECAGTGILFGVVALPPLPASAAALALLAGVTAQAGWPLFCAALPVLGAAAAAGFALAPDRTTVSTVGADAVGAGFALAFGVALAQVSFRQALRLHARERSAAGRARRLESITVRMEPYLAPSLRARLQGDPAADGARRERRWLSVAFVDLAGFTPLAARVEAEPLAAMLDEYLAGVCELALRQGGEVTKVLGDGVLVAFGLDGPDDRRALATGAVRFCMAVPPLLERLAGDWRARGDLIELRMRAGVASGHCTVGDWGGAGYLDFTMIGGAVNLASRLQASAPEDGVLLDAATAALVERDCALGPPQVLEVRGIGTVMVRQLEAVDRTGPWAEPRPRG
jgi:class 3 adenylate cyclase